MIPGKFKIFTHHKAINLSISLLLAAVFLLPQGGAHPYAASAQDTADDTAAASGQLMFIENAGQFDGQVLYQVSAPAGAMWLTSGGYWLTLLDENAAEETTSGVNLKVSFDNANKDAKLVPFGRLETSVNYFIGKDAASWRTNVPAWSGVRYENLYPGIDLEVSGEGGRLTQRLVAQPGADLGAVALKVEGAESLSVSGGQLQLETSIRLRALPLLEVSGAANLPEPKVEGGKVNAPFSVAGTPDVISQSSAGDLLYGTFIGGHGMDWGKGVAVDASGAAYVTGMTYSYDFPTTPGAFDGYPAGDFDIFIIKLTPDGSAAEYATYLGGSARDNIANSTIAVDGEGSAYLGGYTESADFPTTPDAFSDNSYDNNGIYIVKLNPLGSEIEFALVIGNLHGMDAAVSGIAVDQDGAVVIAGADALNGFIVTPGAYKTELNSINHFILKLTPDGSDLVFSTLFYGSFQYGHNRIAIDQDGDIYIAGVAETYSDFPVTAGAYDTTLDGNTDIFLAKLDASGSVLLYFTFLGGLMEESVLDIAVDSYGKPYILGRTNSADFPVTPGAFNTAMNGDGDLFLVKMDLDTSTLVYGTLLGGSSDGYYSWNNAKIALDALGNANITGSTSSNDFPVTPGAYDSSLGGSSDAFYARLNVSGLSSDYITLLGGRQADAGADIAIGPGGVVYIAGETASDNFPVTANTYDGIFTDMDAFMVKMLPDAASLTYSISGTIRDALNNPIADVNVLDGQGHYDVSDTAGFYEITGLPNGSYTLTPVKSGYTFDPASRQVTISGAGITSADFTATSQAAAAVIETIDPPQKQQGSEAFDFIVTGSGFTSIDKVYWNGQELPTEYISPTELRADVAAAYLAATGIADITVDSSDPVPFTVYTFADVLPDNTHWRNIEGLYAMGITGGCETSPLLKYCPAKTVTRQQMAVFLLRSMYGKDYTPPAATGVFSDVPLSSSYAPWIEALYNEGITGGCSTDPLMYCPAKSVTRGQMAVFLLRAKEGSTYTPPPATGIFTDVPLTSSTAPWIEELSEREITGGCNAEGTKYCPSNPVTRGQMGTFIVRMFEFTPLP